MRLTLTLVLLAGCAEPPVSPDAALDADADTSVSLDTGDGASEDGALEDTGPDAALPEGLVAIDDFNYVGAFRISSADFGGSNVNYAVGTLGYNPTAGSIFIAGHAQHTRVGEFAIPETLGESRVVEELPVVETSMQDFVSVLSAIDNPDGLDRITGLLERRRPDRQRQPLV